MSGQPSSNGRDKTVATTTPAVPAGIGAYRLHQRHLARFVPTGTTFCGPLRVERPNPSIPKTIEPAMDAAGIDPQKLGNLGNRLPLGLKQNGLEAMRPRDVHPVAKPLRQFLPVLLRERTNKTPLHRHVLQSADLVLDRSVLIRCRTLQPFCHSH